MRHLGIDDSLTAHLAELFDIDEIDFVHARNVTGGCMAFTATRD